MRSSTRRAAHACALSSMAVSDSTGLLKSSVSTTCDPAARLRACWKPADRSPGQPRVGGRLDLARRALAWPSAAAPRPGKLSSASPPPRRNIPAARHLPPVERELRRADLVLHEFAPPTRSRLAETHPRRARHFAAEPRGQRPARRRASPRSRPAREYSTLVRVSGAMRLAGRNTRATEFANTAGRNTPHTNDAPAPPRRARSPSRRSSRRSNTRAQFTRRERVGQFVEYRRPHRRAGGQLAVELHGVDQCVARARRTRSRCAARWPVPSNGRRHAGQRARRSPPAAARPRTRTPTTARTRRREIACRTQEHDQEAQRRRRPRDQDNGRRATSGTIRGGMQPAVDEFGGKGHEKSGGRTWLHRQHEPGKSTPCPSARRPSSRNTRTP